jgi:hypothetical protein
MTWTKEKSPHHRLLKEYIMQETQRLRNEIMSVVNLLPLDGLRLLAEFVEFLRSKFKLTVDRYTTYGTLQPTTKRSVVDILADGMSGQRLFKTATDVNTYLQEERDAWEN